MDSKDLQDPEFVKFVRERFPQGPVEPDDEDYDAIGIPMGAQTDQALARRYRLAQASKLIRMHDEWKASLN
jgi:hypothetical protein